MGLRRRANYVKFEAGDLVTILPTRKFPVVLRSGPGYTCFRIDIFEPGQLGIILRKQEVIKNQIWLQVLNVNSKIGWILKDMVDRVEIFE